MYSLTRSLIKNKIADSQIIFKRGENIFKTGNYYPENINFDTQSFNYFVDGNYGDYDVNVNLAKDTVEHSCTCPYPGEGCKHTVAICLDILDQLDRHKDAQIKGTQTELTQSEDYLSHDDVKLMAIEERKKRARTEEFDITLGDTFKGEHLIVNTRGKEYMVTLHDPASGKGHCTCPDFATNKLGTCKHIIHLQLRVSKKRGFASRIKKEKFPFIHVFWDSSVGKPRYFFDRKLHVRHQERLAPFFDNSGLFLKNDIADLYPFLESVKGVKNIKVDGHVLNKINDALLYKEIQGFISTNTLPDVSTVIKAQLYPYQKEGVNFALYKKSCVIADEMGLGKTLQAITLALLKKNVFNIEKVLVITPASLKDQWKKEIERFSDEKVTIITGNKAERQNIYKTNTDFFKLTNYEAVLRDIMAIQRFKPDLVILDEAQRIKNFETKTAQAIKSIPHKQSLVITGTPLENKLEDLYSIMQFVDPDFLTPLWEFAAEFFIMKKNKKNKIAGYQNLESLHQRLKPLIIRRKKEEVLKDLPAQVTNNYYLDLTAEQSEIHLGYLQCLLPILNKKFLTPIDIRRIQELLVSMRMVCDSTFLIDRKTNISPKLQEFKSIISDMVLENKRKTVIFTEWTTMTFLIGKVLSELGIPFVEFTGKVPVTKRDRLITEFKENSECMVFLSTDAGGVGLNLQNADCVINFELPWNPAKLNQRIGRVMRIGQKSKCVNVINLISKKSIEEKILAGLHLKQELFDGVFDGTTDKVEFTQKKKAEFINKIREMMQEEPIVPAKELSDSEEIPDSTPHFLNPKALEDQKIDVSGEDEGLEESYEAKENIQEDIQEGIQKTEDLDEMKESTAATSLSASPEKMEEVLDNGMKFLSGLMAMATGKPLITDNQGQGKNIKVNRETGEVTMTFKLPGF